MSWGADAIASGDAPADATNTSTFVRTIEHRQGLKIMCLEEIALDLGFVTAEQMASRAAALGDGDYGRYLRRRLKEIRAG